MSDVKKIKNKKEKTKKNSADLKKSKPKKSSLKSVSSASSSKKKSSTTKKSSIVDSKVKKSSPKMTSQKVKKATPKKSVATKPKKSVATKPKKSATTKSKKSTTTKSKTIAKTVENNLAIFDYDAKFKEVNGNIVVRWVDFSDKKRMQDIYSLREKVYCDEQGYDKSLIKSKEDKKGIHICAYLKNTIISSISCCILDAKSADIKSWGMHKMLSKDDIVIKYGRRVELVEYRGLRINEFITCCLLKTIFEELRPKLYLMMLAGVHKKLYPVYRYRFGFQHYKDFKGSSTNKSIKDYSVYIFDPLKELKYYYNQRKKVDYIKNRYNIKLEQFSSFLEKYQRNDILSRTRKRISAEENVYVGPLNLQAEFPRLHAQAKILFQTQDHVVEKFGKHLPKSKNGNKKFLDIGCAAGSYLSFLRKSSALKDYSFSGLDNSEALLKQAKVFYPKVEWIQQSIYDMSQIGDNTYDVVHASLVFIHLVTPMIAIKEIFRIIKPGGHLCVVDVVDKTFEGMKLFKKVIDKHDNVIRSDRNIMMYLPEMCSVYGLVLKEQVVTEVNNLGSDAGAEFDNKNKALKLGKNIFWGMFSFIGHRNEVAHDYQRAEKEYFNSKKNDCKVDIYSQIFKKKKK